MENPTTPEQILDQFDLMIKKLARKWVREPRVPFDDLCSIGQMTAINATTKFDNTRGVKLSTYLWNAINNAMLDFFKKNRFCLHASPYYQDMDLDRIKEQESKTFSLDKNFGHAEYDLRNIIEGSGMSPDNAMVAQEEWDRLRHEIKNGLSEREAFIVNNSRRWFGHMTYEDIGSELGVTKQRVSQIEKDIFEKLYDKFATEEVEA